MVPFEGLLIHFARQVNAAVIIRGLRAVSDFEYEIQMANMNARMEPNVETIFLMASDRHQFIASSLVKDIARLGGDTSQFVSKKVFERLKRKFSAELTARAAALTVGLAAPYTGAARGFGLRRDPERARSSTVEHLTFNQRVVGSTPTGLTTGSKEERARLMPSVNVVNGKQIVVENVGPARALRSASSPSRSCRCGTIRT